jgi:hypothetical protein
LSSLPTYIPWVSASAFHFGVADWRTGSWLMCSRHDFLLVCFDCPISMFILLQHGERREGNLSAPFDLHSQFFLEILKDRHSAIFIDVRAHCQGPIVAYSPRPAASLIMCSRFAGEVYGGLTIRLPLPSASSWLFPCALSLCARRLN